MFSLVPLAHSASHSFPVASLRFTPLLSVFVVAHGSGDLVVYDRSLEQEEALAAAEGGSGKDRDRKGRSGGDGYRGGGDGRLRVAHNKTTGANPVERWSLCDQTAIHDIAFSPDGSYLAAACADGYCRLLDVHGCFRRAGGGGDGAARDGAAREGGGAPRLVAGFRSWSGAFLCAAFSHDSRYLATGGQDDMVSVWDVERRELAARGEGHQNWITAVAFDRLDHPSGGGGGGSRGSGGSGGSGIGGDSTRVSSYCVGSVGQDTQLRLWEFATDDSLVSDDDDGDGGGGEDSEHKLTATLESSPPTSTPAPRYHAHVPRSGKGVLYAELEALFCEKGIHDEPVNGLGFTAGHIVTACHGGVLRRWERPRGWASLAGSPAVTGRLGPLPTGLDKSRPKESEGESAGEML